MAEMLAGEKRGRRAEMKGRQARSSGHRGFEMPCGQSCAHPVVMLPLNKRRIVAHLTIQLQRGRDELNGPAESGDNSLARTVVIGIKLFARKNCIKRLLAKNSTKLKKFYCLLIIHKSHCPILSKLKVGI